jgi:D-alanine-D-alanine ligase
MLTASNFVYKLLNMKQVGIICGGFSSEYGISVKSATTIRDNFPKNYMAYLIFLDRNGWKIEVDGVEIPFDEVNFSFQNGDVSTKIDLAIVFIHGNPGENGKVQAFLEMKQIPYINSGPLASELSFDKWFCNQFLKGFGFKVADSVYLTSSNEPVNAEALVQRLGLPMFVKPCDSGSSFGISRVNEQRNVVASVELAFKEGRTVVIEEFLDGIEVTCGVYRSTEGVIALPLVEIVSENEFFDYQAKYEGLSQEITPARISSELTLKVQEISQKIYTLLQLRSIARIDFMLVNDIPYIIEVNTTPGFSAASIVPKMIKEAGKTIQEFWQEIMEAEDV